MSLFTLSTTSDKMIKEKNPNVAIMLGGAPVTKDTADLFGADGYAKSARNAVQEAMKMIGHLRVSFANIRTF